jgi:probable rRNA maturation factor
MCRIRNSCFSLNDLQRNGVCQTKQSTLLSIFVEIFVMIQFNYETNFELTEEEAHSKWIASCLEQYGFRLGELNYVFCDDAYLLKLNVEFLSHDTLTDIISFDYTMGKLVSGDVYISVERVSDNAKDLKIAQDEEMRRVMIHGVLHYMGFKDKNQADKLTMRVEEDKCLNLFK